MVKEKALIQTHKGFYRAPLGPESRKAIIPQEIKAHGIKIEIRHNAEAGPFLHTHARSIVGVPHPMNGSMTLEKVFEGRKVVITVHPSDLVEVFLNASQNPVTYEEFSRFCSYLEGLLGDIYILGDSRLIQIGLNYDIEGVKLDGVKFLKLQQFRNAWSTVYQKHRDTLRVETHLTTEISLQEAIDILKALGPRTDEEEVKKRLIKKATEVATEEYVPPPPDDDSYMYG